MEYIFLEINLEFFFIALCPKFIPDSLIMYCKICKHKKTKGVITYSLFSLELVSALITPFNYEFVPFLVSAAIVSV